MGTPRPQTQKPKVKGLSPKKEVQGSRCRVITGFRVKGLGFWVQGLGF